MGSPKTPPDDDISSSLIRLSLGELLLSRARFRFTESLCPCGGFTLLAENHFLRPFREVPE